MDESVTPTTVEIARKRAQFKPAGASAESGYWCWGFGVSGLF